jgi:hypothetical protein
MTIFRLNLDPVSPWKLALDSGKYTVKQGDTFSILSKHLYGEHQFWPILWAYNKRMNPHSLVIGEVLNIPNVFKYPGVPQEVIFLAERMWNRF